MFSVTVRTIMRVCMHFCVSVCQFTFSLSALAAFCLAFFNNLDRGSGWGKKSTHYE